MNAGIIAVLWFGHKQISMGTATAGEVVAVVNYSLRTAGALSAFSMIVAAFSRARASAQRVDEALGTDSEAPVRSGRNPEGLCEGGVEFEHVSFQYPHSEARVLTDICFKVRPGETVAILGATGSGKSSLMQLVLRLYEEAAGVVRIDGRNARELDMAYLHRSIGYVSQEVLLFSGTIRDNIAWGLEDASMEQVMEAAKLAQIHETIEKLPDQYDTLLGQRGINLSGGQKQRLSIARALIRKPAILLLDDSTSALDVRTEAALLQALKGMSCTTLLITQKISSTIGADLILLLDEGSLIAQGNPWAADGRRLLVPANLSNPNSGRRERRMWEALSEPFRYPKPQVKDAVPGASPTGKRAKAKAKNWQGTLRRIWHYLSHRRGRLALVMLMVVVSCGLHAARSVSDRNGD